MHVHKKELMERFRFQDKRLLTRGRVHLAANTCAHTHTHTHKNSQTHTQHTHNNSTPHTHTHTTTHTHTPTPHHNTLTPTQKRLDRGSCSCVQGKSRLGQVTPCHFCTRMRKTCMHTRSTYIHTHITKASNLVLFSLLCQCHTKIQSKRTS